MALRIVDGSDFRAFDVVCDSGQIRTLRVRTATTQELAAADLEFSRVFNRAICAGLPPRARMLRKLRESKVWSVDDDQKLDALRQTAATSESQLSAIQKQIDSLSKGADGKDLDVATLTADVQAQLQTLEDQKLEATKVRTQALIELRGLNVEVDQMLSHTADAKADDAQRTFLMACVTEEVDLADGKVVKVKKRVWDSVEKMNAEKDINLHKRAIYEFMMFDNGLASEWDIETPEEKAAKVTEEKKEEPVPASRDEEEGESGGAGD